MRLPILTEILPVRKRKPKSSGPARRRNESAIEKEIVLHARKLGLLCYKFSSPGHRGVPDRLFFNKRGKALFLEIKRSGAKPTALQEYELRALGRFNVLAGWVSSVDKAKLFLDDFAEI